MLPDGHSLRALLLLFPLACGLGQSPPDAGSKACAACHAAIYRSYSQTSMARSSGSTASPWFREKLDRAAFTDSALGASYRILPDPRGLRLEFARDSAAVRGERFLQWFVGSGRVARSYLSSLGGFLFQAPVSYYSANARWDLSPGYSQHQSIHLARAVGVSCLQCHASRLQPLEGTQNGFADPPFLEEGIGCERCHGPGAGHAARMRTGKGADAVVNPAKLDPAARDSVCEQCHLTGAARIARLRPPGDAFRPGRRLSDYYATFLWSGPENAAMGANSHFEKLRLSRCKQAAGDRLWCGACHDVHTEPAAEAAPAFYRARCLNCHQSKPCRLDPPSRAAARDDCASCHMPKAQVRDTEHAVFTDHTIPRRLPRPPAPASPRSLVAYDQVPASDRDLALAYAAAAAGDAALLRRSFEMLRKIEAKSAADPQVLARLAWFYDQAGDQSRALDLSERALRLDPAQVAVAVNLGAYYMQRGRPRDAIRLWSGALDRNPALTAVRMNLAVAQYQSGDRAAAEATLVKALDFDPDHETARKLLAEIRAAP